jgi:A/G-specific adenine glycosylase
MQKSNLFFSKNLIFWYLENRRNLPWRATKDPYSIWLSEIILQQTRVDQGLPYYNAFKLKYPTIEDLAIASEEEVLKLWQGLGYYSRARNLHRTAQHISNNLKGIFPNNFKDLLQLKGVGDYTASAIASICFNEGAAVVDGNVYRVLSRIFGIFTPINSSQGIKEFKELAQKLIDTTQPGTFNQAIMEFGARYCKPQNPDCLNCIFKDNCLAHKNNMVSELPVKLKKGVVKKRYFNYLVILSEDNRTLFQQRTDKGIWQQLYEFPLIETSKEIGINQIQKLPGFISLSEKYSFKGLTLYNKKSIVHKLSHRHLVTRFWIVDTSSLNSGTAIQNNTNSENILKIISLASINKYPVPVLLENFISLFFESKEKGLIQKK